MAVSFVLIVGKSSFTLVQFIYCIKLLNSTVLFCYSIASGSGATGGIGNAKAQLGQRCLG
jgi:hypothetical protein